MNKTFCFFKMARSVVQVFCGIVALLGTLYVLYILVGVLRSGWGPTDGDAVAQLARYNNAVVRWRSSAGAFVETGFDAYCRNSNGKKGRWAPLSRVSDEEGVPPQYGFEPYASTHFESTTQLFDSLPFDPQDYFLVYIRGRGDVTSVREDDIVYVPGFYWIWDASAATQSSCEGEFGLFANNACLKVYMLDRVCVTVSQQDRAWKVRPTYGKTGCGCTPALYPREVPSFPMLGSWSAGSYTQVNSTDVFSGVEVDLGALEAEGRGVGGNSSAVKPFKLPATSWIGDFSSVRLTVRSEYDPKLTAEWLTNGTLDFSAMPEPSEAATILSLLWRLLLWGVVLFAMGYICVYLNPTCLKLFPPFPPLTPKRRGNNRLHEASLLHLEGKRFY